MRSFSSIPGRSLRIFETPRSHCFEAGPRQSAFSDSFIVFLFFIVFQTTRSAPVTCQTGVECVILLDKNHSNTENRRDVVHTYNDTTPAGSAARVTSNCFDDPSNTAAAPLMEPADRVDASIIDIMGLHVWRTWIVDFVFECCISWLAKV